MNKLLEETITLRHELHAIPEASNHEVQTKEHLINFVKEHIENISQYELVDCGKWFYVVYKSKNPTQDPIAFRADFDAVTQDSEHVRHLCGHDGHAATLAGFCILINGHALNRDVYFLFQHAEESGEGGKMIAPILAEKHVGEVYAYHNIPGYPVGQILIRPNTFALASTGLRINFDGHVSHAAYPELGANPAFAIGKLLERLEAFNKKEKDYIEFATVVGISLGNDSFGVSAGNGHLSVTVRSEKEENLHGLVQELKDLSESLAKEYQLEAKFEMVEPFPATYNYPEAIDKITSACKTAHLKYSNLEEPFRWSEDFGYYTKLAKGAMVGVGDGEDSTFLHTDTYHFNDELIIYVWLFFASLL